CYSLLNGVAAHDSAAMNELCLGLRLRCEERRDPGFGGRLSHVARVKTSGNGSQRHRLSQDIGKHCSASAPLLPELLAAAIRHARGMRARMAADEMASCRH